MLSPNERNKLIEDNMALVGQVIKDKVHEPHKTGIFTYDDLFQIGCIGLCKAADTARPCKGCFSTYAYILIRNEIFKALEYATLRRTREEVTAVDDFPGMTSPEPFTNELYGLNELLDDAQANAGGITAKGIEAIRLLAQGYTHREIGERMGGVSANNVSAWVARARKYLKSMPDIAALGELL